MISVRLLTITYLLGFCPVWCYAKTDEGNKGSIRDPLTYYPGISVEEMRGPKTNEEVPIQDDDYESIVRQVAAQTAEEEKVRQANQWKTKSSHVFRFYKFKQKGAVVYSDKVPAKHEYQAIVYNSCYACSALSTVDWRVTRLYMDEFSSPIQKASEKYGVDPALIRAVIHAESNFNPLARSNKGAVGLMQLMPATAKDMGVNNRNNATDNIMGGTRYLDFLLEKFNRNLTFALAAYNAGPGRVMQYNGIPPIQETQTYVKRVKILYQRYRSERKIVSKD